jgi:DNA-binding winged helix-turn-helix (wHTH) protein/TolB-like protein
MVTLLDWVVFPHTNTLRNVATGAEVNLSPRSMDVLVHLIEADGELVTSAELLAKFWSKSSASDHAVHNTIADLRSALGDQASNPTYIKTYAKRGYMLVAKPVIAEPESEPSGETQVKSAPRLSEISNKWKSAAVGVLLLSLLAVGLNEAIVRQKSDVIFVAAFENINVDAANQFWAEQLPASLISHLSKIANINVVSGTENYVSNSAERNVYPSGVDYILSGNVQQESSRLRLQVNLINADDFSTVFSDQFDITSDEVFEVHDEVGNSVAAALSIFLDEAQRQEMQNWGTTSPVAYSMFLKANFHADLSNHKDMNIALDNYMGATNEDRNFVNAYVGLARTATSLGMYSREARNVELREIVRNALREVTRIAPGEESVQRMREYALRIEGTNNTLIEETLRKLILGGNAPDFAYSRYGSLLAEARLYHEAEQYFELTGEREAFEFTSGAGGISQTLIEPPGQLIQAQKENLLDRPSHIAILNGLIRGLVFSGDKRQAMFYLEQLMKIDEDGLFAMLNQVIISGLWGSSNEAGDAFEQMHSENPEFHLSHGAKSFIAGDVASGIMYWRSLTNADYRRLTTLLYKIELFFPEQVLEHPDYLALLEELDQGLSWQRHLMQSVEEMSSVTGIFLHEESRKAFDDNVFLMNNNQWNHSEINYPNRAGIVGLEPSAE